MFFILPWRLRQSVVSQSPGQVNVILIVVNVLFWLFGWCCPVGPYSRPFAILLYAFSHAGLWHLAANMWTLWVFGNPVNRRLGNFHYACVYLGSAIALGLLGRMMIVTPLVGASGAIFAVMAVGMMLMPASMLEFIVVACFPLTLVIGLFRQPKHIWEWLIRGVIFAIPALSALVIVAIVEFFSFWFCGWNMGAWAHLLGLACGLVAVLLLPSRITMPGRHASFIG